VSKPASGSSSHTNDANTDGRPQIDYQQAGIENVSNGHLLRWMFRFVAPVKPQAALAMLMLALVVGLEILAIKYSGDAFNAIKEAQILKSASPTTDAGAGFVTWLTSASPDAVGIRRTLILLGVVVVLLSVFRYLREMANTHFSMSMVFHIREAVYDKLQRVGFGFHDSVTSGQLINRALSDLQNVRGFIQTAMFTSLEIALSVAGNIALLLSLSWWVAAFAVLPLPFWVWYILRFSKRVQPAARSAMEAGDRNVSILTENIAGVQVVKAFATEKQEVDKYNTNLEEWNKRVLRRIRLHANFQPVIRAIATASFLMLNFVAGVLVIRGQMQAGHLLVINGAMGLILGRLQAVAAISEQYQDAIVSARRLYEVLAARQTVPESNEAVPLPKTTPGEVRFEGVTFGYSSGKPVLRDVSFVAAPGRVIAVVGPTGSGKTTLVNLIARFYEPQQGAIRIDGIDIRDLKLSSLRSQVGFVFQETYLFSDTVSANIAYGRPGISDGNIEAAARLAQAHDFIVELPKGYDTMLGERGTTLSGGQRQRLAIARAIVTDPRILVLDDATAAIDSQTEDLIRRGMKLVMAGRTTFVIAHRISTVQRADWVIVIEHGQITQAGTHEDLMATDGHYREVAAAQLMRDEVRPPDAESPSHAKRVRDGKQVDAAQAQARAREVEEL
jgi:ATP-binding cassette, subfamily B, multidrug efflux pump